MRLLVRSLIAALALVLMRAAPATAEPAMWTVRDADSTIVLLGSVHLLPGDLDWRPKALDQALARADDLWFETPTDGSGDLEIRGVMLQQGMMPAEQGLLALLTPEGRRRAETIGTRLGYPPATLDRFRPWLADLSLSVAALRQQGLTTDAGVERALADAAPTARRRYLETPGEQIAFFAGADPADQLRSLEETLRQLDEEPEMFDRLLRAWLAGDQQTIEALGVTPLRRASPAMYERVLAGRNRRWADAIAERLAGSGETVIVVGAGHLAGPDSVQALLRARGVAVEGP